MQAPNESEIDRKIFMEQVLQWNKSSAVSALKIPRVGSQRCDLYDLFYCIQKNGGFSQVSTNRAWKKIAEELGYPPFLTNAPFVLKQTYIRLLSGFCPSRPATISHNPGNDLSRLPEHQKQLTLMLSSGIQAVCFFGICQAMRLSGTEILSTSLIEALFQVHIKALSSEPQKWGFLLTDKESDLQVVCGVALRNAIVLASESHALHAIAIELQGLIRSHLALLLRSSVFDEGWWAYLQLILALVPVEIEEIQLICDHAFKALKFSASLSKRIAAGEVLRSLFQNDESAKAFVSRRSLIAELLSLLSKCLLIPNEPLQLIAVDCCFLVADVIESRESVEDLVDLLVWISCPNSGHTIAAQRWQSVSDRDEGTRCSFWLRLNFCPSKSGSIQFSDIFASYSATVPNADPEVLRTCLLRLSPHLDPSPAVFALAARSFSKAATIEATCKSTSERAVVSILALVALCFRNATALEHLRNRHLDVVCAMAEQKINSFIASKFQVLLSFMFSL